MSIAIATIVLGIAFLAGGIAAIRTGWLLPLQRRHVRRPELFGWAQIVMATAFFVQGGSLLLGDAGVRMGGSTIGMGLLFIGLLASVVAQMSRRTP
ncbi:hypothetical protein [Streptomyces sp. NPDC093111]|uniref:hypothetical protein n=1 Tax=Streptomyces sp. NPDC093111 TaxID=3154978 RepID=UPI0034400530